MKKLAKLSTFTMAINLIGGVREAAKHMQCSESTVINWKRTGKVPPEILITLERLTHGKIKRHEMAPQLFAKYTHDDDLYKNGARHV
jgi:DNA-binding transcriptional regulator YdaS (Cro superfamily)